MALNRAAVASVMSRSFERVTSKITRIDAAKIIEGKPVWLLVDAGNSTPGNRPEFILRTFDLIEFMKTDKQINIDLEQIPATRKDVSAILLQATLKEALDLLNDSGVQALYVNRISAPMIDSVVGIVTREYIEFYYQ